MISLHSNKPQLPLELKPKSLIYLKLRSATLLHMQWTCQALETVLELMPGNSEVGGHTP